MNIRVGFEPQFVLIKLSLGSTADWFTCRQYEGNVVKVKTVIFKC
jgi:hypothetical protein